MPNAAFELANGQPIAAHRANTGASHIELLKSQGYLILDRLVANDAIDLVCAELEPWFSVTPRCKGDFYGWNTTRFGAVLLKSAASQALTLHEQILFIMDALLAPHCDWYQLNFSQAVRIHPGERQQMPHRDEEMWPCHKNGVEYVVNATWALSDLTAEAGATALWPRQMDTRGRGLNRTEMDPAHRMIAEMARGSVLIHLGSTAYGAGANRSKLPRSMLNVSYSLGWLKQYENAFLAYPPQAAKQFPKALRDLLGYRIHRPHLGCYEGRDPAVLFETSSHVLGAVDAVGEATSLELQAYYRDSAC